MSSIIANWLLNILGFFVLYAIYKMYRKYKARPPKHPWDRNAYKWVWKDGKAARLATYKERSYQATAGCLFSFDVDNPEH